MAEKKNEVVEQKKFTSALSEWSNTVTDLVTRDFAECGVSFDEYSKQCAMNAMSSIYQLVKSKDDTTMNSIDTSNLRAVVGQVASLKLNSNGIPREVYFQLRSKKIGTQWVKEVEVGIEGDGNDAMLRNFGVDVDIVYPCWIVKVGDEFTYPTMRGIEVDPPVWTEKGVSEKVDKVVYPIKMTDGTVQYKIAERESVKVNLFAHIRNNLMNETFDICADRYKATDAQKKQIKAKKEEIYAALRACETVDDMLNCEIAKPYISAAWLDTPESMIARKLRNNIAKKFPKNLNNMARQSFNELDETYKASQAEIEEHANQQDFGEQEAFTVDENGNVVE